MTNAQVFILVMGILISAWYIVVGQIVMPQDTKDKKMWSFLWPYMLWFEKRKEK